jgi:hypothetical protein
MTIFIGQAYKTALNSTIDLLAFFLRKHQFWPSGHKISATSDGFGCNLFIAQ